MRNKNIKIILTGAAGTGKSTINNILIDILKEKNSDIKSIDSMSEKFFKKSFFKNIESDEYLRAQLNIYNYASSEYLSNSSYISSRGFADSYAYIKHSLDVTGRDEYRDLISRVFLDHEALSNQNVIYFYFPIEFELEAKELRSTNKDFQEETDKNILKFLRMTDTTFYEVRGTVEERVSYIKKILKSKGIL